MRKFKRLTMTLALLLTAVTGAWAQDTPLVTIESKDYTDFTSGSKTFDDKVTVTFNSSVLNEGDEYGWYTNSPSLLTVAGTNGYAVTSCKFYTYYGIAETGYPVQGESPSVYLNEYNVYTDDSKSVYIGYNGITKIEVFGTAAPAEWPLTSQDGKVWTLDKMPANNIELQVEYEPTKVTMAANDKTMGTVEVSGENKVEWTADTWKGWTSNTKEYTVGDITMTSTENAYIQDTEAGLSFFVNQLYDNSTVTFSTTGDPFSRIEFTMINDYQEDKFFNDKWNGNPTIRPKDNWTFEGKSAVWEGEATKSLTLQSCTTYVSKITFFKAGVPDGVTVNGDGTFTVAKTATVTLTATPAEGYKFLYWEDNQTNTNPVREVTIEPGEADMTYKAVFAEITYNVTFADGIEDADKWKAEPNAAAKNTEVKVTYSGAKKVLGVKAAKKAESKTLAEATAEDKGKLIGTDGNIYADVAAATAAGTTAVAKIIYIGTTGHATYSHGLALALTDEGQMTWEAAKTACNTTKNTSTPVTGATWLLASKDQWDYMLGTNGAGSYTALRDGFTSVGGSNLQSGEYWSSTEVDYNGNDLVDSDYARYYYFNYGGMWSYVGKGSGYRVRACLAF